MMKQATIDQLKAMKFTAMAKAFEAQTAEPATYVQMGFEERFGLLVDAELWTGLSTTPMLFPLKESPCVNVMA